MERNSWLDKAFDPESIAIVGVSRNERLINTGYTGIRFLRMLKSSGFKGKIYAVNPKANEVEGIKVYPSLSSIPEPLDLIIVTVPAASVPPVLEDCTSSGALNVHVCTSGFNETGEAEGKELEDRLLQIAQRDGLRIIGPNCMGYHVPSVGLSMYDDVPLLHGPVALITQSGGCGQFFIMQCAARGIGVSKVISYGNGLTTDATDYLEYLATDQDTRIICMYLEGVSDGSRLTRLVRRINRDKPVIIWKGGVTDSGARAVATHTGSLAGDNKVWDAFFRQTGAIRVASVEEMADVTMTLLYLHSSSGRRAAVFGGGGGGINVVRGDVCVEEGLEVPMFSSETRIQLMEFISLVNQGVLNPMDIPGVLFDHALLERTINVVAADPLTDIMILHLPVGLLAHLLEKRSQVFHDFLQCISRLSQQTYERKPLVVSLIDPGNSGETKKFVTILREASITVYDSLRDACRALNRCARYHEFMEEA
ncbi:CoA-binding protein [Chloroflexota bacterium]